MKKNLILFFVFLFLLKTSKSQITLSATFARTTGTTALTSISNFWVTKFNNLGYKYVIDDRTSRTIKIYNMNNSLYSNIAIPSTIALNYNVYYVSDNLFNLTNEIEYVIVEVVGSPGVNKTRIFTDNGTQIFFRDSARLETAFILPEASRIVNTVFFDGNITKLRLELDKQIGTKSSEIYNLPGTLPCIQCSSTGTTVGRPEYQGNANSEPIFYPNPVKDQIKLKYNLPKDFKTAEIKIQDVQGKLIETFKVSNDFDFIYLPSNYNNGLYLYSLVVDGTVIKTEKIVLSKD